MREPGERRLDGSHPRDALLLTPPPRWSLSRAVVVAVGVSLVAAIAWATLRSIFDITIGSFVVAGLGGWGIGVSLRRADAAPILAVLLASLQWLAGLLLAWLLAMAVLPGSTRSLLERLAATPFLDWLAPQLGIVELGALVVGVAAALYAVRPRPMPT